jgi:hypothetical protein
MEFRYVDRKLKGGQVISELINGYNRDLLSIGTSLSSGTDIGQRTVYK